MNSIQKGMLTVVIATLITSVMIVMTGNSNAENNVLEKNNMHTVDQKVKVDTIINKGNNAINTHEALRIEEDAKLLDKKTGNSQGVSSFATTGNSVTPVASNKKEASSVSTTSLLPPPPGPFFNGNSTRPVWSISKKPLALKKPIAPVAPSPALEQPKKANIELLAPKKPAQDVTNKAFKPLVPSMNFKEKTAPNAPNNPVPPKMTHHKALADKVLEHKVLEHKVLEHKLKAEKLETPALIKPQIHKPAAPISRKTISAPIAAPNEPGHPKQPGQTDQNMQKPVQSMWHMPRQLRPALKPPVLSQPQLPPSPKPPQGIRSNNPHAFQPGKPMQYFQQYPYAQGKPGQGVANSGFNTPPLTKNPQQMYRNVMPQSGYYYPAVPQWNVRHNNNSFRYNGNKQPGVNQIQQNTNATAVENRK